MGAVRTGCDRGRICGVQRGSALVQLWGLGQLSQWTFASRMGLLFSTGDNMCINPEVLAVWPSCCWLWRAGLDIMESDACPVEEVRLIPEDLSTREDFRPFSGFCTVSREGGGVDCVRFLCSFC